jgi:hypothetical protein
VARNPAGEQSLADFHRCRSDDDGDPLPPRFLDETADRLRARRVDERRFAEFEDRSFWRGVMRAG